MTGRFLARSAKLVDVASAITIAAALLLALPALLVPLGLPIEGDAVDYRVPLIRWMLRHGQYPNFPWTMVDDYPMLGELLMLPFYALHPALARLVPLAGYFGLGAAGGALAADLDGGRSGFSRRTLFLAGLAWTCALRPVTLQANLLMAAWILWALVFSLRGRALPAGLCTAAALATRYNAWGVAGILPFLLWYFSKTLRTRNFLLGGALAALGALPFMARNYLLNGGHPFFPVGVPELMRDVGEYGRGKDLYSFVLLPFDLLYTNSFVRGFFDYTFGKLFYVQLALVALFCAKGRKSGHTGVIWFASALFAVLGLVVWFESSQQLRFLDPVLVIVNMMMLVALSRRAPAGVSASVIFLGIFSFLSVQRNAIGIAFGKESSEFVEKGRIAQACVATAGVGEAAVGVVHRDGSLGFLNQDFIFLPGHPYYVPGVPIAAPEWILGLESREGYRPWPPEKPCLLRKI